MATDRSVRIGLIGAGAIGEDHARRLSTVIRGADVVAVHDVDPSRAETVATRLRDARVIPDGNALIGDPDVDAVVVASAAPTHEAYVLAAIAAGKPVFCEKPLATTATGCLRIVEAEKAHGRRFVRVGFMRRFDPAYLGLKAELRSGAIGQPLLAHLAHRNPAVPSTLRTTDAIADSLVHEMDLVRWLFDTEIRDVRAVAGRRNVKAGPELHDPLLVLVRMATDVVVEVELSLNIGYGYHIRAEIVGENGTVALASEQPIIRRISGEERRPIAQHWKTRFAAAYDAELSEWVRDVSQGCVSGPSAWDGYAATLATDAAAESLRSDTAVAAFPGDVPTLYREP